MRADNPSFGLIVAPSKPSVILPDAEHHTTLASAARRAAELNLSEIELAYSGELVESPLEIPHPQLVVRASQGERPAIVFRPQLSLATGGQQMIRLTGGPASRLTIQGASLLLDLPPEPSTGWSLFGLRSGQSLQLDECVLTVVVRGDRVLPARGETRLADGDHVCVFVLPESRTLLDLLFGGRHPD